MMKSKIIEQHTDDIDYFQRGNLVINPENKSVFIVTCEKSDSLFEGVCLIEGKNSVSLGTIVPLSKSYFKFFKGKVLIEQ